MAGTKRPTREIAKERVNKALSHLRKLRGAAAALTPSERRDVLSAVQREIVTLDAAFSAPSGEFDYRESGENALGSFTEAQRPQVAGSVNPFGLRSA